MLLATPYNSHSGIGTARIPLVELKRLPSVGVYGASLMQSRRESHFTHPPHTQCIRC